MGGAQRIASPLRKVLFLVETAPVPGYRRVWNEPLTLAQVGFQVSVICPKWSYPGFYEGRQGIRIYRAPLPSLGEIAGHLVESLIAPPILFLYTCLIFLRD